jgi:hypothetical protein
MLALSGEAGRHLEALTELCDPRQIQRRMLADMRELMGLYLRSPLFLDLMRWNLQAMTMVSPRVTDMLPPFRLL